MHGINTPSQRQPALAMKSINAVYDNQEAIEGFQIFADAMPCIVWIADSSGKLEWYNQGFHRYTGLTPKTAAGWKWMSSVHPDDQQLLTHEWAHACARGCILDIVVRLRGSEGGYRSFNIRARPFYAKNGEIMKWFGTLTDIHDRQISLDAKAHVVDVLMKGYLSKEFPSVKGLKFDAHYRATDVLETLGGDWYDIFKLPDGRVAFSLGDVCGHGIDAAVKMGEAKQAIFVAANLESAAPERVLKKANTVIFLNDSRASITTALYGVIDTVRRTVEYASAGHHAPILARSDGQAITLPNHGFPLGVEEPLPPHIVTHGFTYEAGSMLILYTDGLIEFGHDLFDGEHRLLAAAAETVRCKSEHPARFLANQVLGNFVPIDDVAVLTISFGEN